MIPMNRPLLPPAETLLPYLKKVDESRWYSNSGPLLRAYEERMEDLFKCHVAATSSGTAGLTAALMAQDVVGRVFLPAWSFIATANAVKAAGCEPVFIDVDELTWAPTDTDIIVAPFGAPIKILDCLMVDAAAAFDACALGHIPIGDKPVVISTHATKTFSTGEGGLVLSQDKLFIERVKEIINHGVALDRTAWRVGFNGKMSEYHAAIGHAELDNWAWKRGKWLEMKVRYINAFKYHAHSTPLSSLSWVGSTFALRFVGKNGDAIREHLQSKGVMSRQVWGGGIHKYEAYRDAVQITSFPVTDTLAREVVFIPFSIDTASEEIDQIGTALNEALECA